MVREGAHAAALLDLIDVVEHMQRKPVEDDFRTAATSSDVCLCSFKPYPHSKLPVHADVPRALEVVSNGE